MAATRKKVSKKKAGGGKAVRKSATKKSGKVTSRSNGRVSGGRAGKGLTLERLAAVEGEARWELIHRWIWKRVKHHDSLAAVYRHVRKLPRGMQALWATYELDFEVRNGGFLQYFHNSMRVMVEEAAAGFELYGRKDIATVVRKAQRLATGRDKTLRALRAEKLPEAAEAALRKEFGPLDTAYYKLVRKTPTPEEAQDRWIQRNLAEFVVA